MNKKLEPYISLVDFLADYLGSNTEVVLHDMEDWEKSVVAIRNGHISGRKIGSPVTGLALEMAKSEIYKEQPYKANYKGVSIHGYNVKSATYFIKDNKGKLIGLLCINMDCEKYSEARDILDSLISVETAENEKAEETFNIDIKDLVRNNLARIVPGDNQRLRSLRKAEKVDIVRQLREMGTFMVKGTVTEVGKILGVSDPTIYRYLAAIRKDGEKD